MRDTQVILVIDDDPAVQNVVRLHLEKRGYRVYTASDGEEGLDKAAGLRPDLIILDMGMPKKGGLEFYQDILMPRGETIYPVLVLTGRREFEGLFRDMRADGFIPKPIDFDLLLREVERILVKHGKKGAKAASASHSILILEEDETALARIALFFSRQGLPLSAVTSGAELIRRATEDHPSLFILKLSLSDAAFDLKKIPSIPRDTPIVLYTPKGGDLDKEIIQKLCSQAGVKAQDLIRTDDPDELLARCKQLLGMA